MFICIRMFVKYIFRECAKVTIITIIFTPVSSVLFSSVLAQFMLFKHCDIPCFVRTFITFVRFFYIRSLFLNLTKCQKNISFHLNIYKIKNTQRKLNIRTKMANLSGLKKKKKIKILQIIILKICS